jgi:YVTN family beta-propeller protein
MRCSLLCLMAGLTAATPFTLAQQPYRIVDHWKIGGTGGWDYLLADPPSHLIYVTHGPQVEVIDTNSGKVIATINGMKGTHGIALDDQGKYGYISDGGGNRVVVFDRHTFKTVTTIPAGENPDGIVFDPITQTVWAFNGRSKSVTVIDTATNTVVATLDESYRASMSDLTCCQQLTVVVTQNGSFQALHRIFPYYRLHGSHLSSGAGQALFSDSRITRYSKPELAIDVFPPRLY